MSDALDSAIAALAAELDDGIAVVAVGGYGRREQSLYSDVDIMLLHDGVAVDEAVKSVLYPLWDANLKVGHAVRTVAECMEAARESFETLTALLSVRVVAGPQTGVAALQKALGSYLTGRPLVGQLTAAERERHDTDPYPLMAADLKSGRGGLRTFQGFYWQRKRAELTGARSAEEPSHERQARLALLAARNALHASAGRAVDEFVPDLREAAARWLGKDLLETAASVTHGLRVGDRLAAQRWPDLLAESSKQSVSARLKRRMRRQAPPTRHERPLAVALQAARRRDGVILDDIDQATIRGAGSAEWTEEDLADFVALLDSGERGRVAFDLLDGLGWVKANFPEVAHTIAAPQLAPFHEHPIDTHLWRTVDEMCKLIDGTDEWYSEIAAEIDDRSYLLLAAFFHDIGKALGGNHSVAGARIVNHLTERTGLDRDNRIAMLVRLHLVLSETATKRDTNDPVVLQEVANQCRDLATLQGLYLLSVADARATGRTMWTEWKATLLRNLYVRIAHILEPDTSGQSQQERIAEIAKLAAAEPDSVAAHLSKWDRGYAMAHSNEEIGSHLVLLAADNRLGIRIIEPDAPAPRLSVVASDTTGLLGAIAGVLALHNLEVLDARLFTRADGVACDTLHVRQLLPETDFPEAATLVADLEDALSGDLDVAAEVAEKAAQYGSSGSTDVTVRAPTDPGLRYTPIEVRCSDRPGALFQIVQALYEAGLDIRQARIDTRAGEVRDLFYVLKDGEPIRDVNELQPVVAHLRKTLRKSLSGG